MKKRWYPVAASLMLSAAALLGGSFTALAEEKETERIQETEFQDEVGEVLEDGLYTAEFQTDSGMFHVNEANEDLGILTVKNGEMIFHVSLASKSILNLFPGLAEEAKKDGAILLEPTVDTVTYSDGMTEEVYGFDVPVLAVNEEFDLALIGKKGKWYDHKVSVKNPKPATEEELKKLAATVETEIKAVSGGETETETE